MIPLLISIIDVQIKKQLSLMYSITKGYVKSQEDTKFLIRQISSRESVNQKLYEILETNKRDAVKELGLIEHEGRDVVIALKTKQAIRNVIAKALESLTFLWSRGIIDKYEGIELNKDLKFQKCVALNHVYVETLSSYNEMTIDNVTMKFVIIVYGSVIDTKTEAPYLAPCILPKTCEQVQGTSDLSKLLVILASKPVKNSNSKVMGSVKGSGVYGSDKVGCDKPACEIVRLGTTWGY
ncbi:hypothetical protein CB1_000045009 [Camelus ferus]|nr:hypothetical protein CB1_000045009 [Camelus ferus]